MPLGGPPSRDPECAELARPGMARHHCSFRSKGRCSLGAATVEYKSEPKYGRKSLRYAGCRIQNYLHIMLESRFHRVGGPEVALMTDFCTVDRDECLRLLKEKSVGRVLLVEDGVPTAYPVNYLLRDEEVIFATSSDRKIAAAAVRKTMGFQVDNIDSHSHGGWSVLGAGEPYVVTATLKLDDVSHKLGHSWAPGLMSTRVAIPLRLLHGRRLSPSGLYGDLCTYSL